MLLQSTVVQFIVLMLNLGTGILTARLLGAEGRGIFTAVTTWPQLLGFIAAAGMGNALIYFLRRSDGGGAMRSATMAILLLGMATSTILIAIGIAILPFFFTGYDQETILLARLTLLGTYAVVFQYLYRQAFAGMSRFRLFNICNLLPPFLYLLTLLACMSLPDFTAGIAAFSLMGTMALTVILMTPVLVRLAWPIREDWSQLHFARIRSFIARAAGSDIVGAISGLADRLILIPLISPAELGLYAVALSFSRILLAVHPAMSSIILSSLSERVGVERKLLHDRAFRFNLLALVGAACGLTLLDRPLILLTYGPDFLDAVIAFRILVLEAIFTCLASVTLQLYMASERPGFASAAQAACFGVLVVSMLAVVPRFGLEGAAWCMLSSATLRLGILLGGMPLYLGIALPRLLPDRADMAFLRARLGG